jgi:hypothetical protein
MKHTIEIDEWQQSKQKQHAAEAEGALPQKEAITASTLDHGPKKSSRRRRNSSNLLSIPIPSYDA